MVSHFSYLILLTLFLGACASKNKDEVKEIRTAFISGNFSQADALLEKSSLKKDKKSGLLWLLEKGTLLLAQGQTSEAIQYFQQSLEMIDKLYTTKLSSKAESLFINDSSDDFYGASYERSYAHYYLAKSFYLRYQKSGNKADLRSARAVILAWDTYFAQLQRSASIKTIYTTDLMLKIFGAQIHEASKIKNDKQIALQLYHDALQILSTLGGVYPTFNKKSSDYVSYYLKEHKISKDDYQPTSAHEELKDFLHYKILSLTKELRNKEFPALKKSFDPKPEISSKVDKGTGNVVIVLEEGLIPQKIGRPFSFGLKGAINSVDDSGAKKFLATVGVEAVTAFAMSKLGLVPQTTHRPGEFLLAHSMTKLAVQEVAVEFELPVIEDSSSLKELILYVLDSQGKVIETSTLPIISQNGELAKVVLDEDAVSRYVKTGARIAVKHLISIVAAMQIYQQLQRSNPNGNDFLAKSMALATYLGASKGLSSLEKADTRHWTTLPKALRMTELNLKPGLYKIGWAPGGADSPAQVPLKILGEIQVNDSSKSIFTFQLLQ